MDFGFNAEADGKKTGFSIGGSGDHSPSKVIDLVNECAISNQECDGRKQLEKKTSGSTDDFEHVDHDPFMSSTYPEPAKVAEVMKQNPVDDLLSSAKSEGNALMSDLGNDFSKYITQTKNFLDEERTKLQQPQKPAIVTQNVPTNVFVEQKLASALPEAIVDLEPEHFNDSPVKKNLKEESEKFISSEDLLGDFKDERTNTPEPLLQPQTKIESVKVPTKAPVVEELIKPITPEPSKISKLEENKLRSAEEIKKPVQTKQKKSAPAPQMISAEEMFCRFGLVESLIYWRDVKKSGIVFGAGLVILLAISCFSVISVFAYVSLLILAGTIAFRIYKNVLGAVQKTSEGHPFKEYLELDLNLSQDKVQQIVNVAVAHVNGTVTELRRLFLVEDLVDSIKFGVILWVFTYIGAWFNGMTLVILAFVALFTLPKVYENNKQSIDTYLDLVRSKFLEITEKVKAAVPIGKKPETDKDK